MIVEKDLNPITYNYLSRYSSIPSYYNSEDKKRYYGPAKQLSRDLASHAKHIVKQHESLDTIALKYYNNPLYWWVIADVNSIRDPFNLPVGKELSIPSLNDIKFVDSINY